LAGGVYDDLLADLGFMFRRIAHGPDYRMSAII
jgi:hypothetical protein